jgi:hypothetical protein
MDTPAKKCRCCGETKHLTLENFKRHKGFKSGFDSYCRMCRRAYNMQYGAKKSRPAIKHEKPTAYELNLPKVPVEHTDMGNGVTRVRFGHGWKAQPAQRIVGGSGYTSALANIPDSGL